MKGTSVMTFCRTSKIGGGSKTPPLDEATKCVFCQRKNEGYRELLYPLIKPEG